MLGVTIFGILLTPVFYYVIVRLFSRGTPTPSEAGPSADHHQNGPAGDGHATQTPLQGAPVAS